MNDAAAPVLTMKTFDKRKSENTLYREIKLQRRAAEFAIITAAPCRKRCTAAFADAEAEFTIAYVER